MYYNQNARDKIREGKFYASWRREIYPKNGEYYEFANLKGKGHYVGTVHLAQGLKAGMTGFLKVMILLMWMVKCVCMELARKIIIMVVGMHC